jgi:hypothetical protein
MADMYGAVRSNEFRVKDPAAFVAWFKERVLFGDAIEVWDDGGGVVSFGGYEQYPSAYPRTPGVGRLVEIDGQRFYEEDEQPGDWDLEEFAAEIRKHLEPGEEFRVLAAGNEKLRYVSATHLIVTHDTAEFHDYYEGN